MSSFAYAAYLHSITIVTVILQIFLFYLIRTKSPRNMKNYAFYLNVFTFWDMIFGVLVGSVLQPESVGVTLVRPCGLISLLDKKYWKWAITLTVYSAINVVLGQDFCLVFRYMAVHENKNLQQRFMSKRAKLVCLLVGQIFAVLCAFCVHSMLISPEDFSPDALDPRQREDYTEHALPGEYVFTPDLTAKITRAFIGSIVFMIVISEIIAIYVICSILLKLKRNAKFYSKNTYRLHFQLTILLGTQISIPILFLVLPTMIRWFLIMSGIGFESGSSRIAFMFVSIYTLTNSTLTIAFVGPFRSQLYNIAIYSWLNPLLRQLKLDRWAPRRKSLGFVSTTRPDLRQITIFKQSNTNSS